MNASFIPPIINSAMFQQQGLGLSTRSVEADLQTKLDVCPALPQEATRRGFKRCPENGTSKAARPFSRMVVLISSVITPAISKIIPLLQKNFSFELFVPSFIYLFYNSLAFENVTAASQEVIICDSVQVPHAHH